MNKPGSFAMFQTQKQAFNGFRIPSLVDHGIDMDDIA